MTITKQSVRKIVSTLSQNIVDNTLKFQFKLGQWVKTGTDTNTGKNVFERRNSEKKSKDLLVNSIFNQKLSEQSRLLAYEYIETRYNKNLEKQAKKDQKAKEKKAKVKELKSKYSFA